MTRSELKTSLRDFFENNVYYEDVDLNNAIQDAYDEAAAFTGCIWKATTLAFQQNLTYYDFSTLISDYLGVVAIFNSTTKRWMFPLTYRKLDGIMDDWETRVGTPEFFCPVSCRYVAIYRKPGVANYGNMHVFYKATAPTLIADTDEFLIPEDFDSCFDYCATDLWEMGQEFSKAGTKFSEYIEQLAKLKKFVNSRNSERQPGLR